MKKTVKWVLLVVAAIIVILAGIGSCSFFPLLVMKPAKTGYIPDTNIYSVKNVMNTVYFIKTDSGYIMIDAGSNAKKFEASLKEAAIDTNDVKWIFLTHSDYDHVDSLPLFPNANIYMGKDELPLINGTVKRNKLGGNVLPAGIDINAIILLSDGQELSFDGTNVECVKAPGHTPGSMAYLVDGRYLFTGDAFMVSKGSMGIHPYTMDADLAKKTIERLKKIITGGAVALTAHYGYHEKL